tara:strand:- start:1135 stop:1416 length:282 start_codon:yes stop_codon:yes gene_type:complete
MKNFQKKILGHTFLLILVSIIFITIGWDSNEWNGLDETNDLTTEDKLLNRIYFTCITFSSVGYGDISPKSKKLKLIASVVAYIVIIEIFALLT